MHLLCPHCQNPIELVKLQPREEIACPSCGSSFHLDTGSTGGFSGRDAKKLGRFELIEMVGQGAFGTVYRARDSSLDRVVAVKIPRSGNMPTAQGMDRFLREARSVAQLRHPSIVSVHDVGQEDDTPYLVSDFITGMTLADLLSGRRPSFREAAEMIAIVADALQYAHEHGVVHRDIKPSNIMRGDDGQLHVMDFGLAKREAGEITMTIDGQILGTPAYMSPEQARGDAHQVDGRSDIYSLGVILYQMLTGELPFRGTQRMLIHQVLHDEPRAPRQLNDRIPRDLDTICLKCMEKEPSRRYQSARDLADDLRRFMKQEPILARPMGRVAKGWRWCKRNPLVASLTSALVVSLLSGLIASSFFAYEMRGQRNEKEFQRGEAERLTKETQESLSREEAARRVAQRRLTEFHLERGRSQCEQGDVDQGLASFARALRAMPDDAPDLEFVARANLALWRPQMLSIRTVIHHRSELRSLEFSRDGKVLLTASLDRTARLWNPSTGEPLGPELKHSHQVEAAALGVDGQTILTGCMDGTVRLWNGRTGELLSDVLNLVTLIREVVLTPDGETGFTRDNSGKVARISSLKSGKPKSELLQPDTVVTDIALTPDGKTLFVVGPKGRSPSPLRRWDVAKNEWLKAPFENKGEQLVPLNKPGEKPPPPFVHPGPIELIKFNHDGTLFATASDIVRIWDAKTGELKSELGRHGFVRDVAFSNPGGYIATASTDSRCILWTLSGTPVLPMPHASQVAQVGFIGDGIVVTASAGIVRLWDKNVDRRLGQNLRESGVFAISPDGGTLACASFDGMIRIMEYDAGIPAPRSLNHTHLIRAAAFSPDGRRVLTGGQDKIAQLWDTATGKPIGAPMKHKGTVAAVAFSPDGKLAATASWGDEVRLWNALTGESIGKPMEHGQAVFVLAFSPDSRTLLAGGNDKQVRFWDTATCEPTGEPLENPTSVRTLALSADGSKVATAQWRAGPIRVGAKRVRTIVWNAQTRKASEHIFAHEADGIQQVEFSPDGASLFTSCNVGLLRRWDVASGRQMGSDTIRHERGITEFAVSRDGKFVLTGSWDQTARVWDVESGHAISRPMQHQDAVLSVALSADGKLALTGSQDNFARLWHAPTGFALGPSFWHRGDVPVVAISPDGSTILTACGAARMNSFRVAGGSIDQIDTWIEMITGLELREDGAIRVLKVDEWQKRRERLKQLGPPDMPRFPLPLESMRPTILREPGPFGMSHLSGN